MKAKIKKEDTLSMADVVKAVKVLEKNKIKPVWRLTWEFPFLKRFFYIRGNK